MDMVCAIWHAAAFIRAALSAARFRVISIARTRRHTGFFGLLPAMRGSLRIAALAAPLGCEVAAVEAEGIRLCFLPPDAGRDDLVAMVERIGAQETARQPASAPVRQAAMKPA